MAQKQHTVTGHRELNEWRQNVNKLNRAQNADAKGMQSVSGYAVGTRQIKSTGECINQYKSPYAGEHQLKMTRGWFIQTIKWRPTSIEAKKWVLLSKQNHEPIQRSQIAVR